jgi:ubiquinone/menaquinone biosynthesis C-methylase UbiE
MTAKGAGQDYVDIFDARGDLYNEAASIATGARDVERQLLIDVLRVEPPHVVCDAPAGGGFLADAVGELVHESGQVICVEPSKKFAEKIDSAFVQHIAPLHDLPLGDATVDRVGSLAGLHHLRDKSEFFCEAYRILHPGGWFAVADVLDETPAAEFLNGPVDRYTATGHQGIFLQENEGSRLLVSSGFTQVSENHRRFHWGFSSVDQLVCYCKVLFGMVEATEAQVHDALTRIFAIEHADGEVRLPWSLVYAVGQKPAS